MSDKKSTKKPAALAEAEAEIKNKTKAAPAKAEAKPAPKKPVAKVEAEEPQEEAPVAIPKGGADLRNVPIENIKVKSGFNPRTDLGDYAELKKAIKTGGLLNPITVVPTKPGADTFYVLAGHRRFASVGELGFKHVPIRVLHDIDINSSAARGLALMENSEDGRSNLSEVDQAKAFAKMLADPEVGSAEAVARLSGYSSGYVKRQLKINDLPSSVKTKLAEGKIAKRAALAVLEIPEEVRDRVVKGLSDGVTEADIRRITNDARKEVRQSKASETADEKPAKADKKAEKTSKHNRPVGQSSEVLAIEPGKKEVRKKINAVAADLLNACDFDENDKRTGPRSEGDETTTVEQYAEIYHAKRNQLAALWYTVGALLDIDPDSKEFESALDDAQARLAESTPAAEAVEQPADAEETKPAKKAKKA